jgi:outer membrane receptor protein involved in Fe transport
MRFTQILRATASCAVLAAFAAGAAQAQDAADNRAGSIDELVVTAQKREQNLQDVPIVVTTLSEEALDNAGVRDIKDLQVLTPGLTVTSTSNEASTTARIRGIGTVGDNPGLESSVGVVIDGVYRPRNGVSFGDLGELTRIEVLKGPQGTLFGKNTSAGVINIITAAPSFTPGFEGELTAGNYGAIGAAASVTGALIEDTLAGRLYVAKRERDGFYDVFTGEGPRTEREDNDQDFWTARGQLLWQPTDRQEWRLIADYTKRDENCCAAVQTRTGPTVGILALYAGTPTDADQGVLNPADPERRLAFSNRPTDQEIMDRGVSLQGDVDLDLFGGSTLTSVTALRTWELQYAQDADFSSADIWYRDFNRNRAFFNTFSQELRLAGGTDRLNWLVGGFFAKETLKSRNSIQLGNDYEPYWSTIILSNVVSTGARLAAAAGANNSPAANSAPPPGLQTSAGVATSGPTYIDNANGPGVGFGQAFPAGSGYDDNFKQDSTTFALFTNNSLKVTDALELTLGLRFTMEEKDLRSAYRNLPGNIGCQTLTPSGVAGALIARGYNPALFAQTALPGETAAQTATRQGQATALVRTTIGTACLPWTNPGFANRDTNQKIEEEELTGTAKAAYRWSPELMTYASYARGYKAGGFNQDRVLVPGSINPDFSTDFPAEIVDSWEVGAKSTLFDRSVLLNATLFHQTFTDFQLNTFLGTSFIVESIPEVTSKGMDADFFWFTPVDGFSLQGGLTYARTEYGNFTPSNIGLSLLPGNTVSFAPEWSGSIAANYDREFGGLRVLANLSAKYTSEFNTKSDLLPAGVQDAFTLVNGRVGFGSPDERWTLELWAQNLTDETYKQVVFNAPLQGSAFITTPPTPYSAASDTLTYNAFLGAPRTYGVTLRVRY